jgi:acetyl esterase/lipase
LKKKIVCEALDTYMEYDLLEKEKGSIIICPGGGYQWRSPREADPVARAFEAQGWQAYVLAYAVEGEMLGTLPLRQVAWAVRTLRQLKTDAQPIVVCGFSAGAHLAASLGVHWDDVALFPCKEEQAFHRPDAMVLGYPVITADNESHTKSIERLAALGDRSYFSLEKYVKEVTPPTFLWHTADDPEVSVNNSLVFANALMACKVPWEMHVFSFGQHGLSLATEEVSEPQKGRYADSHVANWFPLCLQWLQRVLVDGYVH